MNYRLFSMSDNRCHKWLGIFNIRQIFSVSYTSVDLINSFLFFDLSYYLVVSLFTCVRYKVGQPSFRRLFEIEMVKSSSVILHDFLPFDCNSRLYSMRSDIENVLDQIR